MPLFEYSGFDAAGKKVSGMVEAAGRRAVLQKLRSQGVFPTTLREESAAAAKTKGLGGLRQMGRKVPVVELAAATRQLAVLIGAGLPLDEALATIVGQLEQPVLSRALGRVREEVIQGEALHTSLAGQGKISPST